MPPIFTLSSHIPDDTFRGKLKVIKSVNNFIETFPGSDNFSASLLWSLQMGQASDPLLQPTFRASSEVQKRKNERENAKSQKTDSDDCTAAAAAAQVLHRVPWDRRKVTRTC